MKKENIFKNKRVLITGGTGSFGKAFVKYIFTNYKDVKEVVIFSRDEQKQHLMKQEFPTKHYPIKYYLGDVRDKNRLLEVTNNIDILIHSAAIKHVPAAEENPMECIKTNILGSQNIIDAALINNIQKVVALSTDKAASPVNVYGASKFLLEKLFVYANNCSQNSTLSVVRYGNIFGSKGSVVPFFLKRAKEKKFLPITNDKMTRFSITLQESINLVMYALIYGLGGEIIVPIAPSYNILDVAKAIDENLEYKIVGLREGEKLYETMVTFEESFFTVKNDNFYIISPPYADINNYEKHMNAKKVENGFVYRSDKNDKWLSVEELKKLLKKEEIIL
jgi:UDP-N-acetylglucosamine 4,6-dehydratase (inverting)